MKFVQPEIGLSIILGLILLMLVWAAYVAYPIYRALQATKSLMEHAVPYEQFPANPTLQILVAGDSTAVGTGAANPSESTAGHIGAEYPQAEITNIGVNGLRLNGLITKLEQIPTATKYDLIVLQIGANDVTGFTNLSKVSSELDTALTLAQGHSSHVVLLTAGDIGLSPVFRFPLSSIVEWRTREVRTIFMREIAKYPSAKYVDLFKERKDEVFNTDIPKYYAADFFHPTGAGYAVWYESMRPVIEADLGSGS